MYRFHFNLSNPLAGDIEHNAELIQGHFGPSAQPISMDQYQALAVFQPEQPSYDMVSKLLNRGRSNGVNAVFSRRQPPSSTTRESV